MLQRVTVVVFRFEKCFKILENIQVVVIDTSIIFKASLVVASVWC